MKEKLITARHLAAFHDDGVIVIRKALSRENIEKLRQAVNVQIAEACTSPTAYDFEKISAQIFDQKQAPETAATRFDVAALSAVVKSDPDARPLQDHFANRNEGFFLFEASGWRHHRAIRDIAFDSAFPALAARLLDTPIVSYWDDTTFVKGPFTRQKTAFHQDLGYNAYRGENSLVIWTPLDTATQKNGVTKYVRGSHKTSPVYAPNLFVSQTLMPGAQAPKCPDIEANEQAFDIVSFDVEPGDVIVHHIKTLHGAGGNRTNTMRRAISFHYCGADARYFDRPGAAPRLHDVDQLKDGDLISSRDHPIVWPRAWPQLKLADLLPAKQKEVEAGAHSARAA